MSREIWKSVLGWERYYSVSNLGRVSVRDGSSYEKERSAMAKKCWITRRKNGNEN